MFFGREILCLVASWLALSLLTVYLLYSCNEGSASGYRGIPRSHIEEGRKLAALYCSSCHQFPDPSLLDKGSWEKTVLPAMGPRLGIFYYNGKDYPSSRRDPNISLSFYPSKPLVDPEQWGRILEYYIAKSPDTLRAQARDKPIRMGMPFFKAVFPEFKYSTPVSCFVGFDSTAGHRELLVADVFRKNIYRYRPDLSLIDSLPTPGPVVDIDFEQDQMVWCNIGILNPNNQKRGTIEAVRENKGQKPTAEPFPLFDSLARPVQLLHADLNGDGRLDYLICEFGNLNGALVWMENRGDSGFVRHLLRAVPGAIRACIQDHGKNGLPDIWVLFAQGDEGIFLFTNKGNGNFDMREILPFPPVFGSSYFELADFNHDGFPDILYTCGDNADYSPVLKPYHGVYIYMNDGRNNFTLRYFYPINGCYKAIARDFDGDGDLDIAAIAFFADYQHQPEEGFVYFENKGDFNFQPYSLPEAKLGRWLTLQAADIDGDGKTDLILGNFSLAPSLKKSTVNWKEGPSFMVLKNICP
jgi:hypothetical protein